MFILKKIFNKFSKQKLFIISKREFITYEEFYDRSLNFALCLNEKNKSISGKSVFLKIDRSTDYFIALFGLCFLGAVIFPISPKISNNELEDLRVRYKPFLEIDNIKFKKNLQRKNKIYENLINKAKIVFFTSGTTGQPKGIVHNVVNLLNSASKFAILAKYSKGKKILHNWPHYYMAGFFNMFLCPLVSGSTIYYDDEININSYLEYWNKIKKKKINIAYLSPTMAQSLISYSNYQRFNKKNLGLINIISTGSYLYSSTAKRFKELFGVDLINCYGVTEIGGSISLEQKPFSENKPLGKIYKGIKIKISTNKEILVKSDCMFEGYLENHVNFKKFTDEYFNTGDLGENKNGNIYIKGRNKEIIKKGGEQVSLLKIEDIALGFNETKEVIARGVSSEFWGEEIELDVIFNNKTKRNKIVHQKENLKKYLLQKLPKLYIPRKINSVKFIPKTSIGKNYRKIFN